MLKKKDKVIQEIKITKLKINWNIRDFRLTNRRRWEPRSSGSY